MTTVATQPPHAFLFLPADGEQFLCTTAGGGAVLPRARAPGYADARYKISTDGKFFGALDFARKRLAVYEVLDVDPWMRRVVPPTTLPRRCLAHDFLLHNGQLIVGGASNAQENIWVLDYTLSRQPKAPWHALEVPPDVQKKGKSIDLVYILNEILVAVDNVLVPKWFVFYSLRKGELPTPIGIHPLRVESAFESIYHGTESDKLYALYSRGASHGLAWSYVQIYFKDEIAIGATQGIMTAAEPGLTNLEGDCTTVPTALRSRRRVRDITRNWHFKTEMYEGADPFADLEMDEFMVEQAEPKGELPAAAVYAMMFCKDWLFLAMGNQGVWVADTKSILQDRRIGPAANFQQIPSVQLTNVFGFAKPAGDEVGVFAVGHNVSWIADHEWHSLTAIESLLKAPPLTR